MWVVLISLLLQVECLFYIALSSGGSHNPNTTTFCLLDEKSGSCVIASPPLSPSLLQSGYALAGTEGVVVMTSVTDVGPNGNSPTLVYTWRPSDNSTSVSQFNDLISG